MTVVRDRSGRLLLERGAFPYLAHMWLPPTRIAADDSPAANGSGVRQRTAFRHAILHREFQVQVSHRLATVDQLRRQAQRRPPRGVERRVFTPEALARIGRSALLTKALAHLDRLIQP